MLALVAHARVVAAGDCQQLHRVYPADGATDVPTNASVWIFGDEQKAYKLDGGTGAHLIGHSVWSTPRIQKLDLGRLAPRHLYTVTTLAGEHVTTFTTGDLPQSTRPAPPILKRVRFDSGRLVVSAEANENVAVWVRTWRFGDAHVPWTWQLFPAAAFDSTFETCSELDGVAPRAECVELRSVDVAYNRSVSVSNCTLLPADPSWLTTSRPHRSRHFVVVSLIAVGVLIGVAMLARRRRFVDLMPR